MPLHNEGEWWGAERERGEGEGQNNLRELTDQLAKKKKKKVYLTRAGLHRDASIHTVACVCNFGTSGEAEAWRTLALTGQLAIGFWGQ